MLEFNLNIQFQNKFRTSHIRCSANVESGKTLAIYGPSGSGKSTVLKMLAGLTDPDAGEIYFKENAWFLNKTLVKPRKRNVGFVFQEFNLFPNMTVEGNLRYASKGKQVPEFANALIEKFGLQNTRASLPKHLSGGEQQRISLIRSLCQEPDMLLLDEPFSALDDETTSLLVMELKKIQSSSNMTIVLVTHRKEIVESMATSVAMLKEGEASELISNKLFRDTIVSVRT